MSKRMGWQAKARWFTRCVAISAVAALMLSVFVAPATASETWVQQCRFRLDNPHVQSEYYQVSNAPIIRVHSFYYCTSQLASVSSKVSLRFCGPEPLAAEACAVIRAHKNVHTHATGINYASDFGPPFTTTDSDPYPSSGWYVATAVYEACIFNGGNFVGSGISQYVYYNASTNKIQFVRDAHEFAENLIWT